MTAKTFKEKLKGATTVALGIGLRWWLYAFLPCKFLLLVVLPARRAKLMLTHYAGFPVSMGWFWRLVVAVAAFTDAVLCLLLASYVVDGVTAVKT